MRGWEIVGVARYETVSLDVDGDAGCCLLELCLFVSVYLCCGGGSVRVVAFFWGRGGSSWIRGIKSEVGTWGFFET